MADQTGAKHEWILFKRAYGYDEDKVGPNEVDARWCAMCGTLDLGATDEPARFFTTSGIRKEEPECTGTAKAPLESIAQSLHYFVDAAETTLGIPVAVFQSEGEPPLRVRTGEGDVEVD